MNNDKPSNLIPPAVAALATVVNAASNNEAQSQEGTAVKVAQNLAPTPVQVAPVSAAPVSAAPVSAASVSAAPAQVVPVSSAAPAQNLAPVSAATSAVIAASAPVIAAQAAQKPAQNPAAPTPVSAAPAGQNPAPTAVTVPTPVPTAASASAPAQAQAPAPAQIIDDTIKNKINDVLKKCVLEITDDESNIKYKMIISSEFSNDELQPNVIEGISGPFKNKIIDIQTAINNAVSYLKITNNNNVPLKMKVTLEKQINGGGNKKMRQTKKMKKRKH